MAKKRKKWAILCTKTGKYVSSDNGKLRWTSSLSEAKETAKMLDGTAVCAEWLSKCWHEWSESKVIPEYALAK